MTVAVPVSWIMSMIASGFGVLLWLMFTACGIGGLWVAAAAVFGPGRDLAERGLLLAGGGFVVCVGFLPTLVVLDYLGWIHFV